MRKKRVSVPKRVKLPKSAFLSREPIHNGYVLKSIVIPFKGKVRRLWIAGDYSGIWAILRESVPAGARLQSVRLVINGWLQKRALRPDVADFEQYMAQLVRISPTVTDGISGFALRVVYKLAVGKKGQEKQTKLKLGARGGKRQPSHKLPKKVKNAALPKLHRSKRVPSTSKVRNANTMPYRDKLGRFATRRKHSRRRR